MRLLAITVVLAAMATGCGSDDVDARQVTQGFIAALSSSNGNAACSALTDSTRSKLEQDEGTSCAKAVRDLGLDTKATVTGSDVYVTDARVSLSNGQYAFLGRTPEGWKLDAAGCVPAGRDEPYECELES
jgi:hypothetical protein